MNKNILNFKPVSKLNKSKVPNRASLKMTVNAFAIVAALVTLSPYHALSETKVATEAKESFAQIQLQFKQATENAVQLSSLPNTDLSLTTEIDQKIAEYDQFYDKVHANLVKTKEYRQKVERLVSFLKRHRSPIANYKYADQIISLSEKNGADYRVIIGIMGVESGFCIAPYKRYNCFGYLNKVQYSSFEQAFSNLVPKIARQYAKPFGTNFAALETAYGVHNVEAATAKMNFFYRSLSN